MALGFASPHPPMSWYAVFFISYSYKEVQDWAFVEVQMESQCETKAQQFLQHSLGDGDFMVFHFKKIREQQYYLSSNLALPRIQSKSE